ncbi:adenine phosphoribosyltransferase [Candidatus Caldatribacterium sp. SIUC1]|uniref:adenine phosphoribosyltransferase n=1 Tax=Candidatus Caldatribacterium sp. SIUC1 TaxID=3418365 RepID=UPI000363D06A
MDLAQYIRNIPDFPTRGIQFKDITTLLKNREAFREAIDRLAEALRTMNPDLVVGIEARGFIIGAPVAYILGCGFVPVRKKGKLPAATLAKTYELEYGSATLEIHRDAIEAGQRVVVVDDLLATGGTTKAVCEMVEELGGNIVGIGFVIELESLRGRERLKQYPVVSLVRL